MSVLRFAYLHLLRTTVNPCPQTHNPLISAMNTPWSEGIGNRGPLLPYGGGQKEWEYQVCCMDVQDAVHADC